MTNQELSKAIKLLHPQEGDVLVVPEELGIDPLLLSEVLKNTPIKYALIAPEGKVWLMDKAETLRFAQKIVADNSMTKGVDRPPTRTE